MYGDLCVVVCLQYWVLISLKRFINPAIEKTIIFAPGARLLNTPTKWLNYPTMALSNPLNTLHHYTMGLHIPQKRLVYPTMGLRIAQKRSDYPSMGSIFGSWVCLDESM